MRAIDADALYEQLKQDEEMARNRVLDTESSLPYPNNLNPSYTRYVAQMNERTRIKHMVADAPTIEERKTGKWIEVEDFYNRISGRCSVCGWEAHMYEDDVVGMDYCPNCGSRLDER